MTGNCHVRFLEGRASAMGSGYSILLQPVRRAQDPLLVQHNSLSCHQFCDHSVTSADVRLSGGPNLSRAAGQRPVDLRQSQAWTGGPNANPSGYFRFARHSSRISGRVREGSHNRHTAIGLAPRRSRFQKPERVASKSASSTRLRNARR